MDRIELKRKDIRLAAAKPVFERVKPLLDPPMEITRARLPGLNMVDETIIVRESLRRRER